MYLDALALRPYALTGGVIARCSRVFSSDVKRDEHRSRDYAPASFRRIEMRNQLIIPRWGDGLPFMRGLPEDVRAQVWNHRASTVSLPAIDAHRACVEPLVALRSDLAYVAPRHVNEH